MINKTQNLSSQLGLLSHTKDKRQYYRTNKIKSEHNNKIVIAE